MKKRLAILLAVLLVLTAVLVIRQSRFSGGSPDKKLEQKIIDGYHKIFYARRSQTWLANHWLGVQTSQNPNDAWITQEILVEQKPDYVVETGTKNGGSALIWAMILREVNPGARVITIDIVDKISEAKQWPLFKERIDFLLGSSTDAGIVQEVGRRTKGKKVVVLLDSDHSKKHVLAEMKAYAPMVNVGSYMIVQDGILSGHPIKEEMNGGPWEAIDEFLAVNQDFLIDHRHERLLFTYCPRGYLRRIR
ncbi:MAG: CmcI family methyltransferase [Acidobacteriota bacterium]|nr:CmcI family methyltransferase [Acidobacteriota bacterium]